MKLIGLVPCLIKMRPIRYEMKTFSCERGLTKFMFSLRLYRRKYEFPVPGHLYWAFVHEICVDFMGCSGDDQGRNWLIA